MLTVGWSSMALHAFLCILRLDLAKLSAPSALPIFSRSEFPVESVAKLIWDCENGQHG